MAFLFNEFIYNPIYNLLIFFHNVIPIDDFGIAIVAVTIFIKLILIPLSRKQIESQKAMQKLQPKIKELQKKYKDDKAKQSQALMALYKENKANPFSGCFPMIVQLIFLIAIYRVLFNVAEAGLVVDVNNLYSFVSDPGQINHFFLGIIDLTSSIDFSQLGIKSVPHIILILLAAGFQYIQSKMLLKKQLPKVESKKEEPDFAQMMSKQMLFLGPLLTLFIGFRFPAGLALYWLVSTAFMVAQQYYLEKELKKKETAEVK